MVTAKSTLRGPWQRLFVLAAETFIVLLLIYVPSVAQTQSPTPPKVVEGLLTKVNPDLKTFSLKPPDGEELEFSYTDDTEILNADRKPEGLAEKAGVRLRVTYGDHAGKFIATKIEVGEKPSE